VTGQRRGQTLPDFAVGISIFLVTVTFLFLFIPQVTLPYEDQEQPVVAERVTSDLGNQLLADGETPSKLNESCTLAFFTQSGGTRCQFETADSTTEQLGIDSTYSVNATLRNAASDDPNSAILCGDDGTVGDCGSESLAVGPPVPQDDRSVATARRRVFVGGTSAVIEVGVW
jgi:hypothetical protein